MRKKNWLSSFVIFFLLSSVTYSQDITICRGILPPNDYKETQTIISKIDTIRNAESCNKKYVNDLTSVENITLLKSQLNAASASNTTHLECRLFMDGLLTDLDSAVKELQDEASQTENCEGSFNFQQNSNQQINKLKDFTHFVASAAVNVRSEPSIIRGEILTRLPAFTPLKLDYIKGNWGKFIYYVEHNDSYGIGWIYNENVIDKNVLRP